MHQRRRPLALVWLLSTISLGLATGAAHAQDADEEEYKPQLPEVAIYKAMLDANKQTGWIQFRDYDDRQLIYFTALQTMHCRLSEIRYSINSDALDQRFPLAKCNPQLPFNLPGDETAEYVYISLPAKTAQTLTIQAVWDDGAGSEIVVTGARTCASRRSRRTSPTPWSRAPGCPTTTPCGWCPSTGRANPSRTARCSRGSRESRRTC